MVFVYIVYIYIKKQRKFERKSLIDIPYHKKFFAM